jgi:transcription antitermination protein NusB
LIFPFYCWLSTPAYFCAPKSKFLRYIMISRRNLRIKVMQALYALRSETEQPNTKPSDPIKLLSRSLDQTLSLFSWMIFVLTQVARYAETDAHNRAGKYRPSEEDLNVPTKIAGSETLWKMLESPLYRAAIQQYAFKPENDIELIRKVYQKLYESTPYQIYNAEGEKNRRSEAEVLEFVFTDLMLASEDFTEVAENTYPNWDDDADMLRMLIQQFIQKPGTFKLEEMINKEKRDFAMQLLKTTIERREQLQEMVKPKLRNWEAERIALLDMILLEMGICEFLYFDTIPPKVTINEYIDLAKAYSTPQSGQFVNGILDNVRKDLETSGKLHKSEFRK